jgi:hypothetical protein
MPVNIEIVGDVSRAERLEIAFVEEGVCVKAVEKTRLADRRAAEEDAFENPAGVGHLMFQSEKVRRLSDKCARIEPPVLDSEELSLVRS